MRALPARRKLEAGTAGRGAGARGQPKERREKFAKLTFPLPPLGFPLALLFPHSLSPLVRSTSVDRITWREATLQKPRTAACIAKVGRVSPA